MYFLSPTRAYNPQNNTHHAYAHRPDPYYSSSTSRSRPQQPAPVLVDPAVPQRSGVIDLISRGEDPSERHLGAQIVGRPAAQEAAAVNKQAVC